jgi:hypothetical protein
MPSCRLLVLLIRSVLSSTSLSTCHFSITASHLLTSRIPRSFAQSLHVVSEPAGHEVARLSRPDPGSSRPGIGLGSGRHKPFKQIRLNADQVAVADDIVTTAAHRLADFRMTVETSDDRKAIDAAISGLDDLSTALRSGDTSFLAGNRRAAMKMIKLTIIDEGTGDKLPTFLNPESFVAIRRQPKYHRTVIAFSGDGATYVLVTQTPKAIFKLIDQAQDMSAPDNGLYDTSHDKAFKDLEAAFDRDFDDHLAFAEYDKYVAAQQAPGITEDMSAFLGEVRAGIIDSIRGLRVTSRTQHPNGRCSITLAGSTHDLRNVQVGDDVDILPGRIAPVTAADLELLLEFEEESADRDGEIWMEGEPVARLIALGWIVALQEGRVLDAAEYLAVDLASSNTMIFMGITKLGASVLQFGSKPVSPPEEAALARMNSRGEVA